MRTSDTREGILLFSIEKLTKQNQKTKQIFSWGEKGQLEIIQFFFYHNFTYFICICYTVSYYKLIQIFDDY